MGAQETISFLGLPVDGDVAEMAVALRKKGFKDIGLPGRTVLSGRLNGMEVYVLPIAPDGLVTRVAVLQKTRCSEHMIIRRFNDTLSQYSRSRHHVGLPGNRPIPYGEDVSFEMKVGRKEYSAVFVPVTQKGETDAAAAYDAVQGKITIKIMGDGERFYLAYLYDNDRSLP